MRESTIRARALAALLTTLFALAFDAPVADAVPPRWLEANLQNTPNRQKHLLLVDSARHRGLMFGGVEANALRNDVWTMEMDGVNAYWTKLATQGVPPSARQRVKGFIDAHDRLVIYGGEDSTGACGDVWALSLTGAPTWTRLALRGSGPTARVRCVPVYDSRADRLLLFGGYDSDNFTQTNDVWAFALSGGGGWTRLHDGFTDAPPGRWGYAAAYDSTSDRLVIVGGTGASSFGDAWGFDPVANMWRSIATSGSAPSGDVSSAAWDPAHRRLYTWGMYLARLHLTLADSTWRSFIEAGVLTDQTQERAFEANGNRMLCLGQRFGVSSISTMGVVESLGNITHASRPLLFLDRLSFHASAYDSVRGSIVVTGGTTTSTLPWTGGGAQSVGSVSSQVWERAYGPGGPTFVPLQVAGGGPGPICQHAMVYDSNRDRFLVFGGLPDPATSFYLNGFWELRLAPTPQWTLLSLTPEPGGRARFSMVFDPVGDRVLLYGGIGASGIRSDLWQATFTPQLTWTPITPLGLSPGPRVGHGAGWDRRRNRMVIFGGTDGVNFPQDVWQVDFSTGSPVASMLPSTGTKPAGVRDAAILMDEPRGRLVVDGGHRNATWESASDTTFALDVAGPQARWSVIALPEGNLRYEHSIAMDGVANELVWTNGRYSIYGSGNGVWTLPLEPPLAAPGIEPVADGLGLRVIGNAAPGRPRFACTFTVAGAATLELFDVTGRRVAGEAFEMTAPGKRQLNWPAGETPTPGLYFASVRQGGRSASARVLVLR